MKTQKERLIELLDTGEGYTVVDFLKYGCGTEARKIISDLIKEGHNITSKWEKQGRTKWKRYYGVQS